MPSILDAPWPAYDPARLQARTVKLVLQVNGRHRGDATVPLGLTEAEALPIALAHKGVAPFAAGKTVRRIVYVPGKILNLVVEN
jgi:leucyl-tRNA synthetase